MPASTFGHRQIADDNRLFAKQLAQGIRLGGRLAVEEVDRRPMCRRRSSVSPHTLEVPFPGAACHGSRVSAAAARVAPQARLNRFPFGPQAARYHWPPPMRYVVDVRLVPRSAACDMMARDCGMVVYFIHITSWPASSSKWCGTHLGVNAAHMPGLRPTLAAAPWDADARRGAIHREPVLSPQPASGTIGVYTVSLAGSGVVLQPIQP